MESATGQSGEIAVRRKGRWFRVKDKGYKDEDGYFFHGGRSDDVIISAGWTMSAIEIEDSLLKHPAVKEAAVIGAPAAYDYGPERCSWLSHIITNWIGDDGFLTSLKSEIRRHNPEGDVIYIDAEITDKYRSGSRDLVSFKLLAKNQDGELSATGTAVAELIK